MNSIEKVLLEYETSKPEWPYPKLFAELKSVGVRTYKTDVANHSRLFYTSAESWSEEKHENRQALEIGKVFSLEGLQKALKRRQENQITYSEFLAEAGASGVATFEADMTNQTVTYYSAAKNESHVQRVPEWI